MKYIPIAVFALVISLSGTAFAQQEINNNGAGANELQPQTQNVQSGANSGSTYSTEDITRDVANSKVLENAQVQELNVTGAPASTVDEENTSTLGWVVMFAIFLAILLLPALLYAWDLKRKGQLDQASASEEGKEAISEELSIVEEAVTEDTKESEPAKEEEPQESIAENVKQPEKPKSKKKKPANKQKRGKKKRK